MLVAIAAISAAALWATRQASSAKKSPGASDVTAPSTSEAIELNGELEEETWRGSGRTGAFLSPGTHDPARPYSDARVMHDATNLYVGLYAADQEMKSKSDAFQLAFIDPRDGSTLLLSIGVDKVVKEKRMVNGQSQAWSSGIKFGIDADGTLDDPSDEDEEWIIEAAIPLASLGLEHGREIRASFARCDTPKGSEERCGSWGEGPDGGVAGRIVLGGL